jgi:prepilin-type N-terminal cleavage/methylation domain-containing protein
MIFMMRKRHSADAGFTLLEVLVAVTLVAMLAVGLYAILRIGIRSWSRGAEAVDANQRHRTVMDLVRKQIASAYPLYTSPDQLQQEGTTVSHPIFAGTDIGFSFVSENALQFWASPGLTYVTYELVQGSDGMNSLVEKETPYTRQLTLDNTTGLTIATTLSDTTSLYRETPLFDNLTSCTFEYLDPGTTSTGATSTSTTSTSSTPQWVTSWDVQDKKSLPTAVSITMVARNSQGVSINRNIVVPIKAEIYSSTQTTTVRAR